MDHLSLTERCIRDDRTHYDKNTRMVKPYMWRLVMNEIWEWFDGEYKAHCMTRELYDKLLRLKDIREGGIYYVPNAPCEYDVILPENQLENTKRILKVSMVSKT